MYHIAAFYHFFDFPDFADHKQPLKAELTRLGIKGSLLLAAEGINGTLAGSREAIDLFLAHLKAHIVKGEFEHKESFHDRQPFGRTKVRLKKEVISLGEPVPSPVGGGLGRGHSGESKLNNAPLPASPLRVEGLRGQYVEPADWNALIADPDTVILDARNSYEVHLGTFQNAIDPATRNFKQLPAFVRHNLADAKDKKIATFCTGGIRCEKFSSWLLDQGYKNVYQLKGGILKYLEDIPESDSRWQGECYVFDERIAVGHGLTPSQNASMCRACGHALTLEDRSSSLYSENESCPYCHKSPPQ